jgi:1-acyl-sn-glycerol-3-phosphate acyltransferase
MSTIRAIVVLALATLWTVPLLLLQIVATQLRWRLAEAIPMLYHRGIVRLLQLKVVRVGTPSPARPTLYVANHVSWLDIIVLDTMVRGSFVAKHEVATWPVFGLFARLQRCVFIERKARRTADHRDEMEVRLEAGDNLILFPEGTSSDGLRLLPFKSAFFVLAEKSFHGKPLVVQPTSIAYHQLNGMPVGRRWMPIFAWVGDENLLPHLWRYLKAGPAEVLVEFHAPVTIDQFASRKALAQHCRETILEAISAAHAGRPRRASALTPLPAAATPAAAGAQP